MRKINIIFLIFCFVPIIFAQNKTCFVSGKIVNEKNTSIKNIGVTLYKPSNSDLIEFEKVKDDGSFTIEYQCSIKGLYLFVEEYNSEDAETLIYSPTWNLRDSKTYPKLSGIKISSNTTRNFDVGTIIAPKYFKVNLHMVDKQGKTILPKELDYSFWFRIKSLDGKLISFGSLNKLAYERFIKEGSILLSFPEGKWILEVSLNNDKGPFLYPTKILEFPDALNNKIQELTLIMSKKKLPNIYSLKR